MAERQSQDELSAKHDSAERPQPRNLFRGAVILCLLLSVILRLWALDSDPYRPLSWSSGLLTDEGFYVANARNGVLFGQERLDDWNNAIIMPTLHLLQKGVFQGFGVGTVPARAISVGLSLLTLGFFYDLMRRAFNPRTAQIGTVFLALDHTFLLYNRMALMDTPGAFVLTAAFWALSVERWFVCGVLMGLAYATRGLAAFAFVVPVAVLWRSNPKACRAYGVGLALSLMAYAMVWYLPHRAEVGHIGQYYLQHQLLPHSGNGLRLNIVRMLWGERGGNAFFLLHTPILWLGAWAAFAVQRPNDGAERMRRLLCGWLLCFIMPLALSSYAPSRYFVLFLPAVCGLAAVAVERGLNDPKRRRLTFCACALWLCINAGWLTHWIATVRFTQRDAERWLVAQLPADSVLLGDAAPGLSMNSRFRAVNVLAGLCNDDTPLERSAGSPRFVVILNGAKNVAWWKSRYPAVIVPANRVHIFPDVVGFEVAVYRVPDP